MWIEWRVEVLEYKKTNQSEYILNRVRVSRKWRAGEAIEKS